MDRETGSLDKTSQPSKRLDRLSFRQKVASVIGVSTILGGTVGEIIRPMEKAKGLLDPPSHYYDYLTVVNSRVENQSEDVSPAAWREPPAKFVESSLTTLHDTDGGVSVDYSQASPHPLTHEEAEKQYEELPDYVKHAISRAYMTRSGMYEGYWRDIDKDVMKYVLHMEMVGPVKNITIIRERDSLILVKMADDGTVSYSVIWMIPGKDNWNGVEGISAPEEAFKSLDEILADTPLAQISPEGIQAMLYIIQHTELTPDEQRMLNESLKEMKIDSEYVMIELLAMLSRSGDEVPFLSKGTMLTLLKRVSAELAQDDPNSQSTNIDAIQASSAILAAESLYSKDASDHIDESHIERTVRYIRMSMEEGIASNKMFQHEIDFIIANVVAREFNNVDYADIVHMIKLLEEERGKYHSLVDYYPPVALSGAYPHRVSYMQSYHFEDNHVLSDVYAVATKGTPQNIEALLSQIALEYHWQTMRMRVQKALP